MGPGTTGKTIDELHNPFSIAIALLIFLSSLVSKHCPNLGKRKVLFSNFVESTSVWGGF